MKWNVLLMVQIKFHEQQLIDNDMQDVEQLLRKHEEVDNLSIEHEKIYFYIWGVGKVDRTVLEDLRVALEALHYGGFEIFAYEYVQSNNEYHYTAPPGKARA